MKKTYGKNQWKLLKNYQAIDATFESLQEIVVPEDWATIVLEPENQESEAPAFVTNILEPINRQEGDQLTVSDLIENGMKGCHSYGHCGL